MMLLKYGVGNGAFFFESSVVSSGSPIQPGQLTYPEMDVAAQAILRQADEIMIKRTDSTELVELIKRRIANGTAHSRTKVESVATILEREAPRCIEDLFLEVQLDSKLSLVTLTPEQRYVHLPQLFRDLVARLRAALPFDSKGPLSVSATEHGLAPRRHRRVTHPVGQHFPYA